MRSLLIAMTVLLLIAVPALADNIVVKSQPPQAVILEAIHAALGEADMAVVGRLHAFNPNDQSGSVVVERDLKGEPVAGGNLTFHYTKFSQDLEANQDQVNEYDPIKDMYGVWFLKKNPYAGPRYVSSLFMMLPRDFNVAAIQDWTTLEAGQKRAWDEYCEMADDADLLYMGMLTALRPAAGVNDCYELVLESCDTLKDADEEDTASPVLTANLDELRALYAEVMETSADSPAAEETKTASAEEVFRGLNRMFAAWSFDPDGDTATLRDTVRFADATAADGVYRNLSRILHDADNAFFLRKYDVAARQYREALRLGCPAEYRAHVRRRLQSIDMLRDGTTGQIPAGPFADR